MGAFFLYDRHAEIAGEAVAELFSRRGFCRRQVVRAADWELWLYPKQLLPDHTNLIQDGDAWLGAVGTLTYRGAGYADSLRVIMSDWRSGTLELSRFTGAFTLLIIERGKITLLRDAARIYRLYADDSCRMLSSSFLSILYAHPNPLALDSDALLDNLLLGYDLAPQTCAAGVAQCDIETETRWQARGIGFISAAAESEGVAPPHNKGEAVKRQLLLLGDYLSQIRTLIGEFGCNIGVSGGYDSRLLLSLLRRSAADFSLHTHYKKALDRDWEVAQLLAGVCGVPLLSPPPLESGDVDDNIRRVFLRYDGRVYRGLSLTKFEYTAEYRALVLGANRLTLTGFGGEIYRNYNHTPPAGLRSGRWIAEYVVGSSLLEAVMDADSRDRFRRRMAQRLNPALKIEPTAGLPVTFQTARRYYTSLWLPGYHGLRCNVENELAFCLSPFTEQRVMSAALTATPFIGSGGGFEAAMIRALDWELAGIASVYGHNFQRPSLGHRLGWWLKSHLPSGVKSIRRRRRAASGGDLQTLGKLSETSALIRSGWERLQSLNLPLNWELYLANNDRFNHALATGCALELMAGRLKLKPWTAHDDAG